MTRCFSSLPVLAVLVLLGGCQQVENPTPPTSEEGLIVEPIQLTHAFARAGEAYFSPDMNWIIFQASSKKDEDYGMYIAQVQSKVSMKAGGDRITGLNTPIRISPEGSWNSCGYFSHDGNSLIFASTVKPREKDPAPMPATRPTTAATGPSRQGGYRWPMPGTAEIYRADGWKGAVSALAPGASTDLAKHAITKNSGYDAECGYSPDGQWIVYCSNVSGDPEIWAMRKDGSKQVQLTKNAGYDGGPFFSPDGKRICYRSDRKGNSLLQVFVADLVFDSTGNITGIAKEKQITDDAAVNFGPYWHPDGRHLIYATSLHGQANFELYLMRDDGTRKTRITFTQGADVLPVFSPDGKYLLWTSSRGPEKTSQLWIARFVMPKGS